MEKPQAAIDEAQHQVIQSAHAAHRSQSLHTHKAAHHDGIRQVVKLLEQAAQHQWHRKCKDQLQRAALRHILCHGTSPFLSVCRGKTPRQAERFIV